jgi:hypothetical protein
VLNAYDMPGTESSKKQLKINLSVNIPLEGEELEKSENVKLPGAHMKQN